jgi:hypothetical protein
MGALVLVLLMVVAHWLVLGLGPLLYALWGPAAYLWFRVRRKTLAPAPPKPPAK